MIGTKLVIDESVCFEESQVLVEKLNYFSCTLSAYNDRFLPKIRACKTLCELQKVFVWTSSPSVREKRNRIHCRFPT